MEGYFLILTTAANGTGAWGFSRSDPRASRPPDGEESDLPPGGHMFASGRFLDELEAGDLIHVKTRYLGGGIRVPAAAETSGARSAVALAG